MKTSENKIMVAAIDTTIRQMPWIDFEVMNYIGNKLIVMGSLDTSEPHDLEIAFEDVFFVSLPISWKSDTSKPVVSLVEGESAIAINRKYQVEQNYHLFRFIAEDYPNDNVCLIGAKNISLKICPDRYLAREQFNTRNEGVSESHKSNPSEKPQTNNSNRPENS